MLSGTRAGMKRDLACPCASKKEPVLLSTLSRSIRNRLPARSDTLHVFGVVLFVVYGWSIRGFLFKVPSFALYFGLPSDLAVLSYMFAFALVESAMFMAALLLLAAILPARVLKQGFAYKSFIIVMVAAAASITFEAWYRVDFFKDMMVGMNYMVAPFIIGIVVSILLLAALFWGFHEWPRLQRYASFVMEQLSIFTYIYVPLGLLGLVVVLIRNLL